MFLRIHELATEDPYILTFNAHCIMCISFSSTHTHSIYPRRFLFCAYSVLWTEPISKIYQYGSEKSRTQRQKEKADCPKRRLFSTQKCNFADTILQVLQKPHRIHFRNDVDVTRCHKKKVLVQNV